MVDLFNTYYDKNREKILEKMSKKKKCKCGKEIALYNMSKHKKTEIHKRIMKIIELQKKMK